MKHYIDWWKMLFWLIGQLIKYEYQDNFKYADETWCWIKIHITYKGKRIK